MSEMEGEPQGAAPAAPSPNASAPEPWEAVQPQSSMIQSEFALPAVEGDENDGRVTVMMAGGSIQANVERWRGQFGDLENDSVEDLDVGGTEVTFVDFSGTYNERRGMMGPVTERPGYRMLAAIIPQPGNQQLFVKGYGPQSTMAKYEEGFRRYVESLASPERGSAADSQTETSPAEEKVSGEAADDKK